MHVCARDIEIITPRMIEAGAEVLLLRGVYDALLKGGHMRRPLSWNRA